MSQFNLPSGNVINSFIINEFGGVDFASSPDNIKTNRSPSSVNMIRDKNGSLRKRMGYKRLIKEMLEGRINGGCYFCGVHYVHSGTFLYTISEEGRVTILRAELSDEKSFFIPHSQYLYHIVRGEIFRIDSNGQNFSLWENAYVPTVIVSKTPSGGGVLHEDYNLLSSCWKEQFLADGESLSFKLEKSGLTDIVSVSIRDENGEFQIVDEDKYTKDLEKGIVTFLSPPEKPVVSGMDNVLIKAMKEDEWEKNKAMLFDCSVCVVYGENARNDRLFLGGNKNHLGMDFYSAAGDFSYFPHMNYSKLSHKNIKGYSVFNGSLYTHFEEDFSGESLVIKRDGNEKGEFVITDKFFAPAMISPHTSLSLEGEGVFFTRKGVFGITVSDVTKEKVCQQRSAFLGDVFSSFSKEALENAHSVIFGDFYLLSIGDKCFVLDGARKSYFSGTPLCSFQYECYYLENIPARVSWTDGKRLFFGDSQGNVFVFFENQESIVSYTDDGEKVVCYFDTVDVNGGIFFKKKNFVSVSAKIGAFLNTGVKIYARSKGKWHEEPIYDSMGRGRFFHFGLVDFESVSFSSNRSEVTLCGKVRIRNTDSVRFRLVNDKAEPFSLIAFGTEFHRKGNYIY